MAGLYLHIPFCKQKCHYCNFYSLASLKHKPELVDALLKEIRLQANYLGNDSLQSIYFGGGTPSLLTQKELNQLFELIFKTFPLSQNLEITLEANPDDLTEDYLKMLRSTPVNRLSVGIQSFHDNELKYLNRLHNAETALAALKRARNRGFESMNMDLIYGIPIATNESWMENLRVFQSLGIDHLSAYNLTREEHTAYDMLIRKGKYAPPDDAQGEVHFKMLLDFCRESGLEQYEISNFAFAQKYALHNTNYWRRKKYLGIGPSAHSFNLLSRSWNTAHLKNYIESVNKGIRPAETEILNLQDQWNEYLMTGFRTKWGVEIDFLRTNFAPQWVHNFELQAEAFIKNGRMLKSSDRYFLTEKGLFFADGIAADFFRTNKR